MSGCNSSTYIHTCAEVFEENTRRGVHFINTLKRLAKFFSRAVKTLSDKKKCSCRYTRAPSPSWKKLLQVILRIVRHLRDSHFEDVEVLNEDLSETNAVKACTIYSIMEMTIMNIQICKFILLGKLRSIDHSTYVLVKRYTNLIEENMGMMASGYRSICLEKYEKYLGNRSTDRSRIIDCVTNTFGLI